MISFRPAWPEDADHIQLREEYSQEPRAREVLKQDIVDGVPAFSLVHDSGEVIAVVMGYHVWNGVLKISALVSERIKDYPVGATKAAVKLMEGYRKIHGLHRIHATVRNDFPEAKKWITYLGFYFEGTLYGYGQDKTDYCMFARYF